MADDFEQNEARAMEVYVGESTRYLNDLEVAPIDPLVAKMKSVSLNEYRCSEQRVLTNAFRVDVKEKKVIYQYMITIRGIREGRDDVEFTQSASSDFYKLERRKLCSQLFEALVQYNEQALGPRTQLYYDLRSRFYSIKELPFEASIEMGLTREQVFPGKDDDIILNSELRGATRFLFNISTVGPGFNNALAVDIVETNLENMSLEVLHFLNVASSQDVMQDAQEFVSFSNGTIYYLNPEKHGVQTQPEVFEGGIYVAFGLEKSVKAVEGSESGMSIVISPKVSLFHKVQTMKEKLQHLFRNPNTTRDEEINHLIRGLYVCPIHLYFDPASPKNKIVRVSHIGPPADQAHFEYHGQKIIVADYFEKHRNWPLEDRAQRVIVCGSGNNISYFPLEVVEICDNIRFSPSGAFGDYLARLIRNAAVLPDILQKRTLSAFKALNLKNSKFMRSAGIEFDDRPIDIAVPILSAPSVHYDKDNQSQFDTLNSGWKTRGLRYCLSGNASVWAVYAVVRNSRQITDEQFKMFISKYLEVCHSKGLNLGNPTEWRILPSGQAYDDVVKPLYDRMVAAQGAGCKFVLVLTNKEDRPVHAALKAYEQKLDMVTQNVTCKNVLATIGVGVPRPSSLTMENIVNKTNVKLGGLNYRLGSAGFGLGSDDLFIGFVLNHVAGGLGEVGVKDEKKRPQAPTILGFAANDTAEPIAFTGDFLYMEASRQGDLETLHGAVKTIFERRMKSRGKFPSRVFVYRNGVSEGELKYILKFEAPLIRKAMHDHFGDVSKLVLVVVTKAHNLRITPFNPTGANAKEMNVSSGMVLDRSVVHPYYTEFYLASTKALQGSTRVPRYVVLCNDAKMQLATIEKLTYDLCFGHQIVSLSTSLPSPVYVAEEYAKRGRNIYNAGVNEQFRDAGPADLNAELTYARSTERSKRVNA